MKASIVQIDIPGFTGYASLYKLDPPYDDAEYVIASSAMTLSGPETLLFKALPEPKPVVVSWTEIGGVKGLLSHGEAFQSIGYTVVDR